MLHRLALVATLAFFVAAAASSACSSSSGDDMGDAGTKDVSHDSTQDVSHDVGTHDAGIGLTCGELLACDMPCSSNACTNACYARATGYAQGLLNAFSKCIADNCPAGDGGPCESPSSSTCSTCNTQAGTGPCVSIIFCFC
jgi:hypothetical protein